MADGVSTGGGGPRGRMSRAEMTVLVLGLTGLVLGRSRNPSPRVINVRKGQSADAQGKNQTQQTERGRAADSPEQISAQGWKDILWRTYGEINKDRVLSIAAGVTFYGLLALFPAIAAFVSIYGLFADPATIQQHFEQAKSVMPYGAADILGEQLKAISAKGTSTLGVTFAVSLLLSLWSANSGMKAMLDALNVAYGEEEKRSFVRLNLVALAFTLGTAIFLILAISTVVIVPLVLGWLPLGPATEWIIRIGRWVVMLGLIIVALALLYRYGPSRNEPEWRWVSVGSVVAAVVWIAASIGLSIYAQNFANYDKTYGSLGAAIGFMIWLWVSTTIILVGAELNAETEHQTAKDSTKGGDKPIGVRGAKMADTVGEAVG